MSYIGCCTIYSKYSFDIAMPDASIPQVIKALNACLCYFGGTPLSLKTDNMKQVVTKSCCYEPIFSEALQQLALHYDMALVTRETIMFAITHDSLSIDDNGNIDIEPRRKKFKSEDDAIKSCLKKAEIIGKVFSKSDNPLTIYAILGIKP